MQRLVRTKEAAEFLGISPAWLNILAKRGKIDVIQEISKGDKPRAINYYNIEELRRMQNTYVFQIPTKKKPVKQSTPGEFNAMAQAFIRRPYL